MCRSARFDHPHHGQHPDTELDQLVKSTFTGTLVAVTDLATRTAQLCSSAAQTTA
jgi:hypothetical protein